MIFNCGKYLLDLSTPKVMGIVNVTPDSFSDGGRYASTNQAVEYALKLVEEGADILDIGGESTRPNATPVLLDEELSRVIPVIEALSKLSSIPISVDTYKPQVMQAAILAGVDIVNDVRALQEGNALAIAANSKVGICLMHMQGTPQTMQVDPQYDDVVAEVSLFLQMRLQACLEVGISQNRVLLDPGFGFGKRTAHNIALLKSLDIIKRLGQPLLVGLSRKSVLGAITGLDVGARLHASIAASVVAAMKGANILRVHDVKATVDALKVVTTVIKVDINA